MVKEAGGQEALRLSTEGDFYATYRHQVNTSIGYYNLLLGPTAWRFNSGLGLSYNDNINYSPQNYEGDFIIRPNVDTQMHWPVSFRNSLDISLGVGYSEYVEHSDYSQFFITPGSGFSFDVYLGDDFKINLHDRITITEDPYQNAGASGSGQNLVSLQNVAGTFAQWTLYKAVANFGFDHVNYTTLSQNQSQPGTASENFFANAGINVRPEIVLGVEAGMSLIENDQGSLANSLVTPNGVQWNAGVFNSTKISDYMSVRLDVGYTIYNPDNTATNVSTSDNAGPYFTASLSHRVNQWVSYTLSAGRSTDLASYGQVQSRYFVRISPNWNFLDKYTISTPFQWQQGTEVYNNNIALNSNENYDQITLGASVTRTLTRKLTGQVSYQYVKESSDVATISYTANIVSLNLTYNF